MLFYLFVQVVGYVGNHVWGDGGIESSPAGNYKTSRRHINACRACSELFRIIPKWTVSFFEPFSSSEKWIRLRI